jgi:hypothetical protein
MKLFLLILGIVVVALNVLLWYSKKRSGDTKADKSPDHIKQSETNTTDFINSPEADELKQAAAGELGIPVEQLKRMSAEEIAHMAAEKGLI